MQTETREPDHGTRSAIAAEIRAEMARQNLTQRQLADRVGIVQQALALRLRGERSFRAEELVAVAAALGVPITELLPPAVDGDLGGTSLAGGPR